ncbi:DUF1571 domain-containing protein, partial [bacterium]|nr:DUF1571 domain-containing protein [bacterium]
TEDKLSHDSEELRQFVTTLAKLAMEKFTAIDDYSGQFIRQERMGKKLNPPETIAFKFRKPFDLYMKFVDGPQKNYEILHARGKYKNQMLVHVAGFANLFLPTVELDPAGGLAMMNNRHSMLEFGLGYVIESYYRDLKTAIQYNELSLKYHGTANVDNRPCWIIEAWLPHERDTYYCTRSIMYFDQESYVPTKMIFYDWNPQIKAEELIEQYTYSNLSFNNGFTDEDFDRNNKEYKF